MNGWGLGPSLQGEDQTLRFSHGGGNEGFRCYVVGYAYTGQGAAVMTNSDNGGQLSREIILGIADEYGWKDYEPRTITEIDVETKTLKEYAGQYRIEKIEFEFSLEVREGKLWVLRGDHPSELVPTEEDVFFALDKGFTIRFKRNEKGGVEAALIPGFGRAVRLAS